MNEPVCKVVDLLFLRFELTNLELQKEYLRHFGMHPVVESAEEIYYRGSGIAPFCYVATKSEQNRFVSAAYYVDKMAELQALAETFGVDIEDSSEPGGGQRVVLQDPDGFGVEVYFGVQFNDAEKHAPPRLNAGFEKTRVNQLQRIGGASEEWKVEDDEWRYQLSSMVMRLGHYAINVASAHTTIEWYRNTLGFLMSDELRGLDGSLAGAFMRADQGDTPVDHHIINIAGMRAGREEFVGTFGHAGFEVTGSIDDLMAGHFHMKTLGAYVHEWGVGRHLLGSQIYDYWRDPAGFTLEHWTDGDLLDATVAPAQSHPKEFAMGQYGPLVPSTFNLTLPCEEVETYRKKQPGIVQMLK